ncbi:aspartate dehydrogenase [Hydrogenophaga sp. OTU3427]|uniref:aspartate dehydrogenase n=1 Tax=Hydrogenophaga sp. OTU3427 TaxID=3043856 RepID=UPI00313C9472
MSAAPQAAARQRVALIGLGAIGQRLAAMLLARPDAFELVGALVFDAAQGARDVPALAPLLVADAAALLACRPDVVVECAGHQAVDAHVETVLRGGCDLVLVSVGSLADAARLARLDAAARAGACQVQLVSGAIGGLDWLGAAHSAGLDEVTYRGRKPPQAWLGTAAAERVDLASLQAATCFFRGSAREAATLFPLNANVAATVGLATLGLDLTRVELWADPGVRDNVHEVEAQGAAGQLTLRLINRPDPQNPRTSQITAHSALHTLLRRRAAVAL